MKWQLYNKEVYSEVYFRGDLPCLFAEWEMVMRGNDPNCIYWLSPKAFIREGYDADWLTSVTSDKRNFPQLYFGVTTTPRESMFGIWATTEIEAFCTLYEMTFYSDFPLSFREIWHNLWQNDSDGSIKLPTMLLKAVLEKAKNCVSFINIEFLSACAGRVLALSGHDLSIHFEQCDIHLPAEEAFVEAMLSKTNKNSGLTNLYFHTLPFSSDEIVARLINGHVLKTFSYMPDCEPCTEEVLDSLRNDPGLLSLEVFAENCTSHDHYATFVRSLQSSTLQRLTIIGWDFRLLDFPMEIIDKLSLMHFSMTDAGNWKTFF